MIQLIDANYHFIARRVNTPFHIARDTGKDGWLTLCNRRWRSEQIGVLEARESTNSDPDSFVCRACIARKSSAFCIVGSTKVF